MTQETPASSWAFDGLRHVWMPYCQMKTAGPPRQVIRTQEEYIFLADGRCLIDGIASWWTACHGYHHPAITDAIRHQAEQLPHVMFAGLWHAPAIELADRLARILPGTLNRVFFCDSGSVAVEVALKIAVQYWLNRGESGRHKFVTFRHGYHGDTTGAMSVCDPIDSMHAHFKGFLLEQFPANIPHTDADFLEFDRFLGLQRNQVAGVILEPLAQMAAGMRFHSPDTLRRIGQLCRKHGLLFIADEIATGCGRTGTMFAVEQADICPDLMCVGKALTGGSLSLAATIASDEVYDAFHDDAAHAALMHGPTYMANPIACAAASASLQLFTEEPRLQQVSWLADQFRQAAREMNGLPNVTSARSLGGIFALSFERPLPRDSVCNWFVERGIWLRPLDHVLYACPPFTIRPASLAHLLRTMHEFAVDGFSKNA